MTPIIEILDAEPYHLQLMANAMTEDSADTAFNLGMTPKKALWYSYRKSIICKSAFIDGKIAAIWGIYGILFSDTGSPWLIMTPEVQKYPFRVAFRYKKELQEMQKMFPILEDYVPENNKKSIKLLELMGFRVSKNPIKLGNAVLRRAERRAS